MQYCRVGLLSVLLSAILTIPLVAREPWSDPRLPQIEGLQVWLDAAKSFGAGKVEPQVKLKEWQDGSGYGRHLKQRDEAQAPTISAVNEQTVVRFDGVDDHLTQDKLGCEFDAMTLFLVGTPFDNPGGYRGMLALNREGANDYTSGLNLDQGHAASQKLQVINVEGAGFGGERDLSSATADFGTPHVVGIVCAVGNAGVKVFLDGKLVGERPRQAGKLAMDRLTIGARFYNNGGPPGVTGFFEGDLAEVLLFDRALNDSERQQIESYLAAKHGELLKSRVRRPKHLGAGHRLVGVPSPAVQVLVPGFTAKELPLQLNNINNLRYRDDGKLIAVGYNGNIYILSDTDGDGLEDHSDLFWESNGRTPQPIGMALTPAHYSHGRGVFLPVVGKLSLVVDTDGDDRADREIVVARGWTPLQHQVDSFGVAVDPRDQSIYFGLGTEQFANAYLTGTDGKSNYKLGSERGTILRVSPDFQSREIVCTGVRFSVGIAFNRHHDLFCTEQEGATWLANGNPFDELLHIQPKKHYGFPPRHPKHLPNVIDEPSTFDYKPQHQSTCGLYFNEPAPGGRIFGPEHWESDALVTGYARGKLYRTKLVKSPAGYIAQNQLIASLNSLTVDSCVSPQGNLVVATHSGGPDWGTGPGGSGKLYQIQFSKPNEPLPILVWPQSPYEVRIAFDRPLDPSALSQLVERTRLEYGAAVAAGDRFEFHRPGYQVVQQQLTQPRFDLDVHAAQITPDRRTLVLTTGEHRTSSGYALTIFEKAEIAAAVKSSDDERIATAYRKANLGETNFPADMDLGYELHGISAKWSSADGSRHWNGWLPHFDLDVSRALTRHSSQHDELWSLIREPGELVLDTKLDLSLMLRPAVQPGSKLDYSWPAEITTVTWESDRSLQVQCDVGKLAAKGNRYSVTFTADPPEPIPVTLKLATGEGVELRATWSTNEDTTERPFPLRRFFLPWSRSSTDETPAGKMDRPELAGGNWARGRKIFFDNEVGCAKCHSIAGLGAKIGPDLSNVVHRDYHSVLRDVLEPSFAINPEFISQIVTLKDGRILTGVPRRENDILMIGNERGEITKVALADIEESQASTTSIMPKGLSQPLGDERLRDLMTFLLTPGPRMPEYGAGRPPAPRARREVDAALLGSERINAFRPIKLVLVSGPKDHGPGEHDYPAWQKVWREWLSCAENVAVDAADPWPTADQLASADVLVFYQHGEWTPDRARDLESFQARGGGLVYLHFAVDGGKDPNGFANRIGLAWQGGRSRFRHGPVQLHFNRESSHPIARNFEKVDFYDESYWSLVGDSKRVNLLATGIEDNASQPLFWTLEQPAAPGQRGGRVMVSILGHFSWTFDDPLFRILMLRSIAWTAHEPVDRFNDIVLLGARVE